MLIIDLDITVSTNVKVIATVAFISGCFYRIFITSVTPVIWAPHNIMIIIIQRVIILFIDPKLFMNMIITIILEAIFAQIIVLTFIFYIHI
jgi:hypothetical protein